MLISVYFPKVIPSIFFFVAYLRLTHGYNVCNAYTREHAHIIQIVQKVMS